MPRARGRAGLRQGKQRSRPRMGRLSAQQGQDQQAVPRKRRRPPSGIRVSDTAEAVTHRYSIEVKDAETGATLILVAAEWTAAQKGAGVALISQLGSMDSSKRCLETDEDEPARG
jgi:hypothetical protein